MVHACSDDNFPPTPDTLPAAEALRNTLLRNREQALTQLYRRAFPLVRRLVLRQGGSVQNAQDVFQNALVVFYEQAVTGELVLTASASTYLLSIARHRWQHELRRRAQLLFLESADIEITACGVVKIRDEL